MPHVHANGLDLYVNRFRTRGPGDRPVVVCLHGLAVVDNAATSFVMGFHLAKHADVFTYDLRGHGRSQHTPSGYHVVDHVSDLVALLDALDLHAPVHLLGFSYGGAIATVAAMRHPSRVASLILLDGFVPVEGWEEQLHGLVEEYGGWAEDARALGMADDEIQEAIVERVMKESGFSRRRANAFVTRVRRLFATTTLRDDMHSEVAYGEEDFARISCPTLGVYGDESMLHWISERLPKLVSDVTIHTVHGADHLGTFWRLDETRPVVADFIGLPRS